MSAVRRFEVTFTYSVEVDASSEEEAIIMASNYEFGDMILERVLEVEHVLEDEDDPDGRRSIEWCEQVLGDL